jgi:phosphoglycolate phosphatase-like HAD superfamily hydrolase
MLQHIRAVLFDLDGTLVDSAPDLGVAVDKMRVARGLPSWPLAGVSPAGWRRGARHVANCIRYDARAS